MLNAIEQSSQLLTNAFRTHTQFPDLPESCRPKNTHEAYACQDAFVQKLLTEYGGSVVGYKIAGLSNRKQQILQVSQPFYGQLLSAFTAESPTTLRPQNFSLRIAEPEYAFELSDNLNASEQTYEVDDVRKAVKKVFGAIEIVDCRYSNWTKVDEFSMIADNALASTWIMGNCKMNLDSIDIVNQDVHLYVNDALHSKGSGSLVLGNPLIALTWLANELIKNGRFLKVGDIVISGFAADVYSAQSGDTVVADFGKLGIVQVVFD